MWVRFCPGPEGLAAPAEVPSDALTAHLDLLAGLGHLDASGAAELTRCEELPGVRTYRVQIGYADGRVATVVGGTDPACAGRLLEGGAPVGGPDPLGVFGLLMTAFGRQYAEDFEDSPSDAPLACPDDPHDPGSVDLDGASTRLDTGYHLGRRTPMVMPSTAVRGIVCTWPSGAEGDEPDVRQLTAEEAERIRIGLHAITGGTADCEAGPEPDHTAVLEDRTGTRRAVSVLDSRCSSVIRSDHGRGQGGGLGFVWLDR